MRVNNNKDFEFRNDRTWLTKELNKPRSKRLIKAYVTMMLNGSIDFKKLGLIYRQDELIPEATVKRLLKYQETRDLIDLELQKALTSNNVTYDYLIKERKNIIDKSKDSNKLEITLKAIEGFENMYNMQKVSQKETKTISESVNYKQYLTNGETNSLTLTKETPAESSKMNEFDGKTSESED